MSLRDLMAEVVMAGPLRQVEPERVVPVPPELYDSVEFWTWCRDALTPGWKVKQAPMRTSRPAPLHVLVVSHVRDTVLLQLRWDDHEDAD